MNMSLPVSRWSLSLLASLAIAVAFIFGTASNASASINYGEEAAETAKLYVGTPYKYGGTTPKAFDASGFTQYVYKHAATKLSLPRTSGSQFNLGKAVKQSELKQGDLVFYATGAKGKVSYVGIYHSNGKFIGTTSKGVSVIKMSDNYWKTKYMGAKRVIK
ncbi:NlpC/P60 family protein [Bacillus sp. M6-12]|uniref:C40 family peptidase n=1 Tax=Bacillus sp. M6-12 TaxID=2054166 RepID=UPI000C771879|nr:C40 family peptidase [Bacillus sp. M6-12]PLS17385.1 NlpC/P60 family protein [Bacillus sp. M6-12]